MINGINGVGNNNIPPKRPVSPDANKTEKPTETTLVKPVDTTDAFTPSKELKAVRALIEQYEK